MLDLNWPRIDQFPLSKDILENWLKLVCKDEEKILGEVSYIYVDDNHLLEINKEFLSHDYYTDIITFDYSEDGVISGDLFISTDRVRDNALSLEGDWLDELNRVMVHGVLHLCGYGDKSDEEVKLMRDKEDFYLDKLKGFT